MDRQTVDFGIDLGTTNSVIACATAGGVEIVSNALESELTPSAVAKDARGQLLVGEDALDKLPLRPVTRFKRLMGTTNTCTLADGSAMTPEELSAEVLKELLAGVQLRYDRKPTYVVITVPAMFLQPQCEATHRAAELTGLKAVALLQEPIAAATAYLDEHREDGNYLVYDLGGGTFDVSVVRLKDREMSVVVHGGDNYLGGSDFDRLMVEWVVQQIKRSTGREPFVDEFSHERLRRICEDARKRLSIREEVRIDISDLELGLDHVPMPQGVLHDLIEELVSRTIRLARERVEQASLRLGDIKSVLLVGGPTKTPYIRRRLEEDLGIPRCHEMNPMTVVARGAAIHASALLIPERKAKIKVQGAREATLELFYDPVAQEMTTSVSGRVVSPEGFAGEIRLVRSGGDWDTGWIPLRNGAFVCDALLSKRSATEFTFSLRDLDGALWSVEPSIIAIRYGVAAARPVTPYKYGVALEGGGFGVIVDDNQPLPAHGRKPFRAARTVAAGSDDSLAVYFLEGRSDIANDNTKVGELRIHGADLSRTLREGEEVEVRMHMDESRLLKARVHVPRFDLEFAVEMRSQLDKPDVGDLAASMRELEADLNRVSPSVAQDDQDHVVNILREKEQLEAELNRAGQGEVDDLERISKKVSDAKSQVRVLSRKYGPQAAYRLAMARIDAAGQMAEEFDDSLGLATLEELRKDAAKCLRLDDEAGLAAVKERADKIFWTHYPKTDRCWIGLVEFLRDNRADASDPISYHEYLKRAEECLARDDMEGVRTFALKAWDYLPDSEAKRNRFYDAGLR